MARGQPTKIKQRLEEFTPIVCRLLARESVESGRVESLTDKQIAARSLMPEWQVNSISWLPTWDSVEVGIMLRFTTGCGINLDDYKLMEKHSKYLSNKPAWKYLRRDAEQWNRRWRLMIDFQREYYTRTTLQANEIT